MASIDQTTQTRFLYFGIAAVVIGLTAYNLLGSEYFSQSTTTGAQSTKSAAAASDPNTTSAGYSKPKKQAHFELKGSSESWTAEDMKKYLSTRNLAVGSNPTKAELIAMVESKMHEPTSTGFNDPGEWSSDDLKAWLEEKNVDYGRSPTRVELLAMVESKMHEPTV